MAVQASTPLTFSIEVHMSIVLLAWYSHSVRLLSLEWVVWPPFVWRGLVRSATTRQRDFACAILWRSCIENSPRMYRMASDDVSLVHPRMHIVLSFCKTSNLWSIATESVRRPKPVSMTDSPRALNRMRSVFGHSLHCSDSFYCFIDCIDDMDIKWQRSVESNPQILEAVLSLQAFDLYTDLRHTSTIGVRGNFQRGGTPSILPESHLKMPESTDFWRA